MATSLNSLMAKGLRAYPTLQESAEQYRDWASEHPLADAGLGLVPGTGAASLAATAADPRASKLDKAMATIGVLPAGKLVASLPLAGIVGGSMGILNDANRRLKKIAERLRWDTSSVDPHDTSFFDSVKQRLFDKQVDRLKKEGRLFQGPDKQIRFEIPDQAAKYTPGDPGALPVKIADAMEHPEFERYYPDIMDETEFYRATPAEMSVAGEYSPGLNRVTVKAKAKENRKPERGILFHETQHAVDEREYRPREFSGTNSAEAGSRDAYIKNEGEMSARITDMRSTWTPEMLRNLPYKKHWDFLRNQLEGAKPGSAELVDANAAILAHEYAKGLRKTIK